MKLNQTSKDFAFGIAIVLEDVCRCLRNGNTLVAEMMLEQAEGARRMATFLEVKPLVVARAEAAIEFLRNAVAEAKVARISR